MQVILGAGGAIGKELAKELKTYDSNVRLFSRNPQMVNDDDELLAGNLTNKQDVENAVAGTSVAYLVAGLPYRAVVWERRWPVIMKNVIAACQKHNARLVFFDNMYLYDKNKLSPMTEETEVNPPSRKGKVRAQIAAMLQEEIKSEKIEAQIVRAADFYGPGIENSIFNEAILNNLKNGKSANWFCSTRRNHNFTWTPDAAKATALLGNTDSAYGEVWHLPTVQAFPIYEWIEVVAKSLGVKPKAVIAPPFLVSLMGLFNPLMREMKEMLYQYDRDYDFDSSKFETVFGVKPTPVKEAMKVLGKNN